MAWSYYTLDSDFTAAVGANKPFMAANSIISPTTAKWTEVGGVASTDRTHADYPACRAYDGFVDFITKPNTTSSSTWYYVLDLGSLRYFNAAALIGFGSWAPGATVITVEVADNSTFATNLTEIATLTVGTNRTPIAYVSDGTKLCRAQYVRIKFAAASPFTPQVGEIILMRTRQLKTNPDEPWDVNGMASNTESSTTAGGKVFQVRNYTRQRTINAALVAHEDKWAAEILGFHRDHCRGNGTFVWCDRSGDWPEEWNLMCRDSEDFSFPVSDYCRREFPLEAHEQGPEAYYLDVELNP